jgi:hypothetical protein
MATKEWVVEIFVAESNEDLAEHSPKETEFHLEVALP